MRRAGRIATSTNSGSFTPNVVSEYFNWESAADAPSTLYVYDFGDEWHHLVTLEDVRPAVRRPRCVAGARACPPEDCGGIHGFADFLDAIADPKHPEHSQLMDWSGGAYDPAAFDPTRVV